MFAVERVDGEVEGLVGGAEAVGHLVGIVEFGHRLFGVVLALLQDLHDLPGERFLVGLGQFGDGEGVVTEAGGVAVVRL